MFGLGWIGLVLVIVVVRKCLVRERWGAGGVCVVDVSLVEGPARTSVD
jgi:hypothetical protein